MSSNASDPENGSRRFDVELFVTHPTLGHGDISKMLDLECHFGHTAGEPRVTPNGTVLPGAHHDTRWRHSTRYVVQDQWFGNQVKNFVESLKLRREALLRLSSSGGTTSLIVQFFCDGYLADAITRDTLSAIVDLGLDLEIECFV
jgi:hypothetical protein